MRPPRAPLISVLISAAISSNRSPFASRSVTFCAPRRSGTAITRGFRLGPWAASWAAAICVSCTSTSGATNARNTALRHSNPFQRTGPSPWRARNSSSNRSARARSLSRYPSSNSSSRFRAAASGAMLRVRARCASCSSRSTSCSAALPASSASTGRRRSHVMVLSFQMAAIPAAPSTLLTGGGPDGTGAAGGAGTGCAERRRTTIMALFMHAVYECLSGRAALCRPRRQTRFAPRD